ncbi:hypothetical protein Z051_27185, partial [Rhodococcus rhodochrous KG-21]
MPAGSTATSPSPDGTVAATRCHASGYCTGRTRPPTPHARSGRASSTVSAVAVAQTPVRPPKRARNVPTPAAAASAYSGTAQATHFCVSRSRPAPGTCTIAHSPACSPGPVAARAGPSTATAASAVSTPSTGLRRRRHSAGTPHATTSSSAAVPTSAHTVARDAGTASAFQMPPSPATLPSV